MYNLGEKFKNNSASLVRLEYDEGGLFNNYETAVVKNRNFDLVEFNKQEDENIISFETRYFVLKY